MSAATPGPLSEQVFAYVETMRGLVPSVTGPADWAPLAAFVAADDFERIGTFCEVQTWEQYTEMLTQWASATDSFETTVHRVTEFDDLVYYEVEERHFRGGDVHVVSSMTVFAFDEGGKIRHLDVYLQQPR